MHIVQDDLKHHDRRALLLAGVAATLTICSQSLPAHASEPRAVSFEELYKSFGVLGYEFSDQVIAAKGGPVRMIGYMAPPLKAESRFFVLTRQPLALCPFCQSDADWPVDIVVVLMRAEVPLVGAGRRIAVLGRLDIGSATDTETGFVSQIRIVEAGFAPV